MRQWLLACSLLGLASICSAQALPAEFDHNRIRLAVPAPDGSTLRFYTDSGGGWNAIARAAVLRLKLPKNGALEYDGKSLALVDFPAFMGKAGVPAPYVDGYLHGKLVETDMPWFEEDGFLGSSWFAGHVWRIDYGRHDMALLHAWKPGAQEHAVPLGFQANDAGERTSNMPRVTIRVDGRPLEVLLDTGATLSLTDDSAPEFKVAPGAQVGGSFIMKTVFDQWHARHPDWRVIDRGDGLKGKVFPLIEVPRVDVGGFTVGPVWFALRPDPAFTDMMSSMMDKPVVGAFGGSGLQYFHVVLDYPAATASFGLNETAKDQVQR